MKRHVSGAELCALRRQKRGTYAAMACAAACALALLAAGLGYSRRPATRETPLGERPVLERALLAAQDADMPVPALPVSSERP